MNAKEFNKYKTALYKKYGAELTDFSHEVKVLTPFGTLYISSEWSPKIKVANIHSRLDGNANEFKEVTGYNINTYNGKCNFYYSSPLDCLDELEEYLSNMVYLSGEKEKTEMKIKVIRYKYNTYNVIDRVYNDESLLFEQSNLNSKNRFGAKKFKCNNGTTLNVNSWEWGNIKE